MPYTLTCKWWGIGSVEAKGLTNRHLPEDGPTRGSGGTSTTIVGRGDGLKRA